MKKNLVKGVMTCLVLFIGLTLNATLGSISVLGFVQSTDGEALNEVSVTCPTNSSVLPKSTDGDGFYSVSGLRNNDILSFEKSGFQSTNLTISDSQEVSQRHDIEMSFSN